MENRSYERIIECGCRILRFNDFVGTVKRPCPAHLEFIEDTFPASRSECDSADPLSDALEDTFGG
jgi:hypothetical protein